MSVPAEEEEEKIVFLFDDGLVNRIEDVMTREIPYNYTSADDALVMSFLLGPAAWEAVERWRAQRVTGRSARLLLRVLGEIFVIRRNPFVFEELLENIDRRRRFATQIGHDLGVSRSRRIGKRTKQCLSKPVRKSMSFSRPATNLETARS